VGQAFGFELLSEYGDGLVLGRNERISIRSWRAIV
jgi:hypothetical protein